MLLLACIALTALALVNRPSTAGGRAAGAAGPRLSAEVLARCGAGRARLERYAARATALVRGLERPQRRAALPQLTAVLGRWYATIRESRRCLGARGVELESRAVGALLLRVTG